MFMKPNRLLYLSAHQMTAYQWRSGTLTGEGVFALSEAGIAQFADYLAQHSRSRFALLANVAEEGFQIETIPFLRGKDRKTVIERRLGQLFFNTPLTAAQSLGYEKSQRKDERLLLAALPNHGFFAPWLATIAQSGVVFSGLYTLALLAPSLLRRLRLADEHCLLLSIQDQSIRQSYIKAGELCFSRVTPLQNSSIGGIAQAFAAEAAKLQQYLASQRLIGRNQQITAYVLAHNSALHAIQGSCPDTPTIRFQLLDIGSCAKKTGLGSAIADSHSEQLFLNLLVASPPRIQFADDDLRHIFHLQQLRFSLLGSGALILAACLLFAGIRAYETANTARETQTLRANSTIARLHYNEIVGTFPSIPTDNATLRRVIDYYGELEKGNATPDGLYREISRGLQAVPTAELESIAWQIGGEDANATAQQKPTLTIPSGSEVALITGTLKPAQNATPKQLLAAFDQLIETLTANPKLDITVLKRPFEIESGKSFTGSEKTIQDEQQRTFSLQIVRKIGS